MKEQTYPFLAKPLPYLYDALLPVIDEQTLHFHHDKHYQTYVDNLNKALAEYPNLQEKTLKELLMGIEEIPMPARVAVRNNAGGVYNHELYFQTMKSPVGQMPGEQLMEVLARDFGSYEKWQEELKHAAVSKFGSGWAWLLSDKDGKLSIVQTANQDVPDLTLYEPLLLVDVWEHAYYLQYQNRRADYVTGWFLLINWKNVEKRYQESVNNNR